MGASSAISRLQEAHTGVRELLPGLDLPRLDETEEVVAKDLPAEKVQSILKKTLSELKSLEEIGKGEQGIKQEATEAVSFALDLISSHT